MGPSCLGAENKYCCIRLWQSMQNFFPLPPSPVVLLPSPGFVKLLGDGFQGVCGEDKTHHWGAMAAVPDVMMPKRGDGSYRGTADG